MYQDTENEYGCPIRFQTGQQAIDGFADIVDRLAPEQRAAFESERAERQAELDAYVAAHGYST